MVAWRLPAAVRRLAGRVCHARAEHAPGKRGRSASPVVGEGTARGRRDDTGDGGARGRSRGRASGAVE